MKLFNTMLLGIVTTTLTGCLSNPAGINPDFEYLKDINGHNISDCTGGDLIKDDTFNKIFWDANNLPHGTTEFICKDEKAYLPEDCQGNPLNREQLKAYWKKYDIPEGIIRFKCVNGIPVRNYG